MFRLFLFSLLIFKALCLGLFSFADDSQKMEDHIQKDEQELEQMMNKFKKDQEGVLKVFEGMSEQEKNTMMNKLNSGDPKAMQEMMAQMMKGKDGKVSAAKIQKLTKASLSTFRQMSHKDLKLQMEQNAIGTPLEKFFKKETKLNEFVVRSLRDEKALPEFFRIIQNKSKLFIFLGISIFTMILGKIMKRKDSNNEVPFLISFLKRFFVLYGIRIGAVVYLFGNELGPLAKIFKDVFL